MSRFVLMCAAASLLVAGAANAAYLCVDDIDSAVPGPIHLQNTGVGPWCGPWASDVDNNRSYMNAMPDPHEPEGPDDMAIVGWGMDSKTLWRCVTNECNPGDDGCRYCLWCFDAHVEPGAIASDVNIKATVDGATKIQIELLTNGSIRVRCTGDPVVGYWDGTDPDTDFTSCYARVCMVIDQAANTCELVVNGKSLGGVLPFRNALDWPNQGLNDWRWYRMKTGTNQMADGWMSLDNFSFECFPEPASLVLLALGSVFCLRRRRS